MVTVLVCSRDTLTRWLQFHQVLANDLSGLCSSREEKSTLCKPEKKGSDGLREGWLHACVIGCLPCTDTAEIHHRGAEVHHAAWLANLLRCHSFSIARGDSEARGGYGMSPLL